MAFSVPTSTLQNLGNRPTGRRAAQAQTQAQGTDTPSGGQDRVTLGEDRDHTLDAYRLAKFRDEMRSQQTGRPMGMMGMMGTMGMKPLLFAGEPSYRAISQGSHGDCYFMASVINLAKNDPEKLKRMIKERKDGTYDVTLRAGTTINVKPLTAEERKKAASAGCNGEWLPILEKAYLANSTFLRSYSKLGDMASSKADVDNLLFTSKAELRDEISKSLSEKKTILASKGRQLWGKKELPGNHAYAVIGFKDDQVTVMNPWGARAGARGELRNPDGSARDGRGDGIMTMSLDEFKKHFSFITYKEPELGRGV